MSGCPVGGGGQLGGSSAIVTINEEGTIQSVDRGCCEMFGYDMHDLPGKPVKVLIPAPYKEQHDSYMAEYHRTGEAKIIGKKRTVEGLHRSGVVFPVRLAVNEVNTGRGRIYIGMLEAMPHHVADFLCDAGGAVLECSGGVEDIWGWAAAAARGKRLEELLPLEGKTFAEVFARYLSDGGGGVVGCVRNARARLSNGTCINVCLSIRHEESEVPPRFRARVERVDRDREAVFTLRPDGTVLSANSAFLLPLMGYTGAELLGANISLVLPDLEGTLLPKRLKRRPQGSSLVVGCKRARGQTDTKAKKKRTDGSGDEEKGGRESEGTGERATGVSETQTEAADKREKEESSSGETFELDDGGEVKRSLWLSQSLGGSSLGLPAACTRCLHKDGSTFFVEVRLARFLGPDESERLSVMVRRAQAPDPEAQATDERTPVGLDFVMGPHRIGAGSFGKVRQGWRTSTNEPVAIKVVEKTLIDAAELQRARREISILRSLEHSSICRLYDVVETKKSIFLVMELCANGELFQYVTSRGRLEEAEARGLFRQIVEAVDYCHSKNIIHRDIKHKNILLDQANRIKLIDFGLSNYATQDGLRSTFCGTPAYSAPEMILAQKYSGPEVDIWSLGVVLFSMLTGEFPFKTVSHIIDGSYTMPDYLSDECQAVLRAMLVVDGKLRTTAKELLAHPFVTALLP